MPALHRLLKSTEKGKKFVRQTGMHEDKSLLLQRLNRKPEQVPGNLLLHLKHKEVL